MYAYALLNKDRTPAAAAWNNQWLGPNTLGIEVTSEDLARRCGLGNIDPQHHAHGRSSAIEDALICPTPPEGATLVTLRPDKDSIGAMAVLTLRAMGQLHKIDQQLVAWIGALDRHGQRNVRVAEPALAAIYANDVAGDVLNIICLNEEVFPNLEEKVLQVGRVLCREMSPTQQRHILAQKPVRGQATYAPEMRGSIALLKVVGGVGRARNWANSRYPIAAIYNAASESGGRGRRWSIVQQPGCLDRQGFERAINLAEAKARGLSLGGLRRSGLSWGGTPNIISSPSGLGRETRLAEEEVLSLLEEYIQESAVALS